MVCCAIITIIIAVLVWPIRRLIARFRPAPLLWQLSDGPRPAPPKFSVKARIKSFGYALDGLGFVIKHEHNARIHLVTALTVVFTAALLHVSPADWIILIGLIMAVWFAETLNTAFEYVCDVVSPEKNDAVRRAKDIAAGAVLITAIGAVVIGGMVFWPYFTGQGSQDYMAFMMENLCRS